MKFQLTESQKRQISKINTLEKYIKNVERSINQLREALDLTEADHMHKGHSINKQWSHYYVDDLYDDAHEFYSVDEAKRYIDEMEDPAYRYLSFLPLITREPLINELNKIKKQIIKRENVATLLKRLKSKHPHLPIKSVEDYISSGKVTCSEFGDVECEDIATAVIGDIRNSFQSQDEAAKVIVELINSLIMSEKHSFINMQAQLPDEDELVQMAKQYYGGKNYYVCEVANTAAWEPAEGGYYVPTTDVVATKGFNELSAALKYAKQRAKDCGYPVEKVNDYLYVYRTEYVDEGYMIRVVKNYPVQPVNYHGYR